jgi:hypothetical protein
MLALFELCLIGGVSRCPITTNLLLGLEGAE